MQTGSPTQAHEFTTAIEGSDVIWHASDPAWDVIEPAAGTLLDFSGWTGATYYSPEDLVVTFRSGTTLSEVQATLAEHGQHLPYGRVPLGPDDPTLAQAIGFALPHPLEGRFGAWRDWILGMTVMLGDGLVAKSGSRVVKSVAGYDAHKLFVGARGAFGVILEVNLRVWPGALAGTPPPSPLPATRAIRGEGELGRSWIQRTLRTDFETACNQSGVVASDHETSTIWALTEEPLARFPHDWALRGMPGEMEWPPDEVPFILRAKSLLDPANKLNPGALGIC